MWPGMSERRVRLAQAAHGLAIIATKGYLGPSLRESGQDTLGLARSRSRGLQVDKNGKMRCPPFGPTANEFTDESMSTCVLDSGPEQFGVDNARDKVGSVEGRAVRGKPAREQFLSDFAQQQLKVNYPEAAWKEVTPGFYKITAGTNDPIDDRNAGHYMKRRWHSNAVVNREDDPPLAKSLDRLRTDSEFMAKARQEAVDIRTASPEVKRISRSIDRGYPMGVESYRVQSLPEDTEIRQGGEVKFALASVGFNPARMTGYEEAHENGWEEKSAEGKKGGNSLWFRFDPSTPGLIHDDSVRDSKTADEFHRYPLEGVTRGKFKVKGDGRLPGTQRKYIDLEYAGPLETTPEFADGESGTLGNAPMSRAAKERVYYAMQEAQLAVEEAQGRKFDRTQRQDANLSMNNNSHGALLFDHYQNMFADWDQEEEGKKNGRQAT